MENLSREAILRMVGLHDAAHMMRQLNAIQLSLEEEQGQMVAYWTEIRKSEKEISLLAGRVAENETDIGQLQVTAQQITASVSSLTTTVNGHTTSIGQLQITANSLTASVTTIEDTVNGHTTSIGALEIESNRVSNRVTVIEGDYVKEAEITLMVKKDTNGYISNALIKADIIDFTFTQSTNFNSGGQTVMNINSSGDLWIKGDLKGGNIQGNYMVGTTGNKMEIYADETGYGVTKTSGIRGFDPNNNKLIDLRVITNIQSQGELRLRADNNSNCVIYPQFLSFVSSNNESVTFGFDANGKVYIYAPISKWPSLSGSTVTGQVYLDNGYLKVKTS
jgi:hypothetical protein